MFRKKLLLAIFASLSVLLVATSALATHFRYGNITYTIPEPNTAPTTVRFDVVAAWRADFVDSINLDFGDGQFAPSTMGVEIGNGLDASGASYKVQRYTVTHTYAAPGVYTASFQSCCRISTLTLQGQHDQNFRVWALVDVTPGNTGNAVTLLPPIFQLQTGGVRTVPIPGVDPDGAPVHCRFATQAECSDENPPTIPGGAAPTLADTPQGCTLTWNTANGQNGQQYALSVVLESFNGTTKSEAVVDHIIELTSSPPPSCTGSGLFNVDLGTQFFHQITGTNVGGGHLKMATIGTFGNVSPVPGTTSLSPFSTTYGIAPSIGDEGVQIMSILYTNSQNLTGFCSIGVNVPDCPVFGQACSAGVGACEAQGYKYCLNGAQLCSAVPGAPSPELCDMIDNNCDGAVDEGNPQDGEPCVTTLPGLCSDGTAVCNAGVLDCIPTVQPGTVAETCDDVDQDCNGVVDDGFNTGAACLEGNGVCLAAGILDCDGAGGVTCNAQPGPPTPEVCDGKDNDCNQIIDDGFPLGQACTSGTGACAASGVLVCDAMGGTTCDAVPGAPGPEVCGNGIDDNCDGVLDDGCADADGDGLFDTLEIAAGLDPSDPDSDDDGVKDGDEPSYATDTDGDGLINGLDPDSDNDGLPDGTELGLDCSLPGTDPAAGHCIPDADPSTTTDPLNPDSDSAGAADGSEDSNLNGQVDPGETDPNDPGDDAQSADGDTDGLGDKLEATLGSDPSDADTDDDGLLDGLEPNPGIDEDGDGLNTLLDADSDNDALYDGLEAGKSCSHPDTAVSQHHCHFDGDPSTTTSVLRRDTDAGGVMDGSEDTNLNGVKGSLELNPNLASDDISAADTDLDGLTDGLEATLGSDPTDADSDDDGVLDGAEANPSDDADGDGQPNLMDPDADNDGLYDGTELGLGCNHPDTDAAQGRCVPDADGGVTRTNPLLSDTDGGSVKDGLEDANHNGVVDAGETDPLVASDDVQSFCLSDADCGTSTSARICDQNQCTSGCRGEAGNGCPAGQTCSSTDNTAGQCMNDGGAGGGGAGGSGAGGDDDIIIGGGCNCRAAGGKDSGSPGTGTQALLLFAGLAAMMRARRR